MSIHQNDVADAKTTIKSTSNARDLMGFNDFLNERAGYDIEEVLTDGQHDHPVNVVLGGSPTNIFSSRAHLHKRNRRLVSSHIANR